MVNEELEYSVDYDMRYRIEDDFWKGESKDWDGILENFHADVNITEKVKRYAGPRGDFHGEKVPLRDFLYYDNEHLKNKFPKIVLNGLGMKKAVSTLDGFTTDLQIP